MNTKKGTLDYPKILCVKARLTTLCSIKVKVGVEIVMGYSVYLYQ